MNPIAYFREQRRKDRALVKIVKLLKESHNELQHTFDELTKVYADSQRIPAKEGKE